MFSQLGGKRGLGAQKVNADFFKIEEEAQKADELKQKMSKAKSEPLSKEEIVENLESIDATYKDLGDKARQTEEKLRSVDPIKAQQFERLGMGFSAVKNVTKNASGTSSGKSHSASSDMMTIEQTVPVFSSRSTDYLADKLGAGKFKLFDR